MDDLGSSFKELFIAPFASHRWTSTRGRSHWVDLEGWQSSIAGPVLSIIETGDCDYAYQREDWYFTGVYDSPSLRSRLLEWHRGLADGIERFVPVTPDETLDLAFMKSVATRMRELIEQACRVEQANESIHRTSPSKTLPERKSE